MDDGGIQEEPPSARFLTPTRSGGTRWVDGSEVDSSESAALSLGDERSWGTVSAEGSAAATGPASRVSSGTFRRRLGKRPRRVDSLDVEAMNVRGAHGHSSKELTMLSTIAMAFQTLGVVYGDMGTSPLYVFSDVFSKVPIKSEVEILGALSLVMYTIALIPFAKYVFIVLKANDNGEGGTFALYSLICRYAKVSLLPNQQRVDEDISSFRLKLPTPELERAMFVKDCLEKKPLFKNILLFLVLMGTSMVIGDGILTPAMSVMSAVSGLQGQVPGFDTDAVVIVSIIVLVLLFSVQRFGTGKVGFMFAPILGLWFINLGSIGIYNIVKYDISVVRAFNPAYIYLFFQTNGMKAWSALGGCVLCITGAEAMFADLGHFSVKSIQVAFTAVVFPCLLIAYMGQAAFLMKNPLAVERIFYDSVPGIAEVGVMMVSTILVTLVMLLIWQTNLFLVLCFPILFGAVEFVYLTAVLSKIQEGGWLPLAFSSLFLCIMYTWNYGSVLKYQSEMRGKISLDFILDLGATLGTVRVPGIGLVYNELVQGIPSIFGQLLVMLPAMHSTIVFVCIKYIPVPFVPLEERFLFRRVGQKDYHMFRCVARYGYKDVRKEDHGFFEQLLVESLEKFLRREAQEITLETSTMEAERDDISVVSEVPQSPACEGDLQTPLLSDQRSGDDNRMGTRDDSAPVLPSSSMSAEEDPALEYELEALREAMASGFTYLLAHGDVRARKESFFTKKFIINYFYAFLRRNCRAGTATLKVPHSNIMRVGTTYMV
ncbi:potassium transporter 23 isoform X2 [Panicum miliaceum]|uniref:Potassium transporter 23 isoform X2 n=1 Tax=Panicum miliaceum TaxID=4540 RepID=A0A3L6QA73_PANMI|nr:potassium transporter 23 isoform X2 [Panicum miliaceum]